MNIEIDPKLAKIIDDDRKLKRSYGKLAKKIKLTISILKVASNLEEVPNCPPTRRHKLQREYKNCWAVDLSANYRLIIKANSDSDDLSKITDITVIGIEDYH